MRCALAFPADNIAAGAGKPEVFGNDDAHAHVDEDEDVDEAHCLLVTN